MPLPTGQIMASEQTHANVNSRMSQAMEDLALKAELQKEEKIRKHQLAETQRLQDEEEQEILMIRTARLARMKQEKEKEAKKVGHGEVVLLSQDELLPTVLNSVRVVIHFFSEEFEQCQVMNQTLENLARVHVEARFAKILANKAPFFVQRFGIQTLPCLVSFEDGKAIGKKIGFRGEDSLRDVEKYLVDVGILAKAQCAIKNEEDEEEEEA